MSTAPKRSAPKLPKLLPWLARKAGLREERAIVLWHAAERHADHRAKAGSADWYAIAVDRLLELVAAESLREDAASFGWRAWARAQSRLIATSMKVTGEFADLAPRALRTWERVWSAWPRQRVGTAS